jgi:hypothetical protein
MQKWRIIVASGIVPGCLTSSGGERRPGVGLLILSGSPLPAESDLGEVKLSENTVKHGDEVSHRPVAAALRLVALNTLFNPSMKALVIPISSGRGFRPDDFQPFAPVSPWAKRSPVGKSALPRIPTGTRFEIGNKPCRLGMIDKRPAHQPILMSLGRPKILACDRRPPGLFGFWSGSRDSCARAIDFYADLPRSPVRRGAL